jgi:broad specificity phosphatase PhoE
MYAVRHGSTSGNEAGTFRGKADLPLSAEGHQDAKNLGKWFADKDISAVYATGKTRTQDTADAIATPKGMKVQPLDSLNAIDVGYLSGEKKSDHPKAMDYFEKYPDEKIPMGESINEFRARTQPPLKQLLVEGAHSPHPIVAVVHSSVIHELNHIITGDHNQTLVKPGGIVGVYHHPTKGLALKALLYPEHDEKVPYHG